MKHLKRHINVAINKEYLWRVQVYTFRKYKIKNRKQLTLTLSPEKLGKIRSLEIGYGRFMETGERQKMLSPIFVVMQDYRYSDFISRLSPENMVKCIRKPDFIYKSVKTNTEVHSPTLCYLRKRNRSLE